MADFEVVYGDIITLETICSKVFAVDKTHFLITDMKGRFIWVPIKDCRLR